MEQQNLTAWEIVSRVLKALKESARVGTSTSSLNLLAESLITGYGGTSINKGYTVPHIPTPFPSAVCISVNNVIGHGIPSNYELKDGDLVNFDLGVKKDGKCGDAALSVGVGNLHKNDINLLKVARQALNVGIEAIAPYAPVRVIGFAIEKYVKSQGYVVNKYFCGHAIGEKMHMDPKILSHYDNSVFGALLPGMQICIEPYVTKHDRMGKIVGEGWTLETRDGHNSAMFEHQIEITHNSYKILTTHI